MFNQNEGVSPTKLFLPITSKKANKTKVLKGKKQKREKSILKPNQVSATKVNVKASQSLSLDSRAKVNFSFIEQPNHSTQASNKNDLVDLTSSRPSSKFIKEIKQPRESKRISKQRSKEELFFQNSILLEEIKDVQYYLKNITEDSKVCNTLRQIVRFESNDPIMKLCLNGSSSQNMDFFQDVWTQFSRPIQVFYIEKAIQQYTKFSMFSTSSSDKNSAVSKRTDIKNSMTAPTAYQFFLKDKLFGMREELKNEGKEHTDAACIKKLKQQWREMNAGGRKEYIQASKLAKQQIVLEKNEVLGRRTMITPRNSIMEKPKRKRDKK